MDIQLPASWAENKFGCLCIPCNTGTTLQPEQVNRASVPESAPPSRPFLFLCLVQTSSQATLSMVPGPVRESMKVWGQSRAQVPPSSRAGPQSPSRAAATTAAAATVGLLAWVRDCQGCLLFGEAGFLVVLEVSLIRPCGGLTRAPSIN